MNTAQKIMINIAVNNVILVKQQYNLKQHLAISETTRCRATKLGEVIETSNSDHTNM